MRPDAIAVEGSRATFETHRLGGDDLARAAIAAIAAHNLGPTVDAFWRRRLSHEHAHFEGFSAAAFAAETGASLHSLERDDASAPQEAVAAAFAAADSQTLAALADHDRAAAYDRDYARARRELEAKACLEFLLPPEQHAAYTDRDRAMAAEIDRLLHSPPTRHRLAVVCAVSHLYFSEARLRLYSILYHATTARHLVDGAGQVPDHPIILPCSYSLL